MKTLNLLYIAFMAIGLSACGPQNQNPALYNNGYNQYGYNNGYGTQTGYGNNYQGGCVPIQNGAFGFTAQGAQMNGAVILAGTLPANSTRPGTYGTVTMGSNVAMTQQGMIQYQPKVSASGQMQIMVSPTTGSLSGSIQLSQQYVYSLMSMSGYNPMYGQQQTQSQLCVQSIALDIVHTTNYSQYNTLYPQQQMMSTGYINQALVYLTLSSGQVVGPIPFL